MPRILIAKKATQEIKIPLDQERITIGRDKKSDLFLDDQEVSRRHAVVINKFGTIYVENVSSTGQIFRGNTVVEFCELASGEEIRIGSYMLSWRDELASQESLGKTSARAAAFAPSMAQDQVAQSADAGEQNSPIDSPEAHQPQENIQVQENVAPAFNLDQNANNDANNGADFMLDAVPEDQQPAEQNEQNFEVGNLIDNAPAIAPNQDMMFQGILGDNVADQTAAFNSDAKTKISTSELGALLKIIKGEDEVREIVLAAEHSEWIVGRGSKCDIPIDNAKISRSHFKIYRDGRIFKVCDLGGTSGTRLNGVSIQDAKLNSFDTIKAGSVEFQFFVGDGKDAGRSDHDALDNQHPNGPSMLGGGPAELRLEGANPSSDSSTQEKTAFAAPVPYNPAGAAPPPRMDFGGAAFAYTAPPGASDSFQIPNPNFGSNGIPSQGNAKPDLPPGPFDKVKNWFSELKPVQKVLYPTLLALLVGGAVIHFSESQESDIPAPKVENQVANSEAAPPSTESAPSNEKPETVERAPTSTAQAPANDSDNAAIKGDIGPKYFKLNQDKRNEIDDAYAKADRAHKAQKWDEAYTHSKIVVDAVEIYKNAADILWEAQTNKNNNMLGNVTTNLNNVADAAKENQEKLELLLTAGDRSLAAQKWADAEENFSRAMNLDPNNARATQGFVKARNKDMTASIEVPNAPVKVDPDEEARIALQEQIQSLNKEVNNANNKIRAGSFNEGLSHLRQLDFQTKDLAMELGTNRAPASIRSFGIEKTNSIQMRIRESIDFAKSQLDAEYQTNLADAEAFISNKQYLQAKDIYNKILKLEPEFDRVRQERGKLYSKIVSEAREKYQEALIHENVGDIDQALEGYEQTRELLQDVDDNLASDYFKKSQLKIRRLKR